MLVMKDIQSGKYQQGIESLRAAIHRSADDEEIKALKSALPAFTPHATFKGGRNAACIDAYSGFIHLDFDKLTPAQLDAAFGCIIAIPYTAFCFRSPSGNGLKVFVEVTSGIEHHAAAYQQVQAHYEQATGQQADPKCKDIPRLCFVSHDPQLYKNINAEKFPVNVQPESAVTQQIVPDGNWQEAFQQTVSFTEAKQSYSAGNRNNFLHLLASNCNRRGIPEDEALHLAQSTFTDISQKEVLTTFRSAYQHHSAEFAKFAKGTKPAAATAAIAEEPADDYLKSTPTFPESIFAALPPILKEGTEAFTEPRKRDVFLTGALSIISGCLPEVTGIYHQERVYPHLFTFIIAPAASGKGVLKNAKRLADAYHKQIWSASRDAEKRFEDEMAELKQKQRTLKKGEPQPEKPDKPPFKIVFIPADCSMARMVDHLNQNEGAGIICETEADTMSGAKKQDWGDYSHMLRAAFHHEKIALSRKTGNEYIEVPEPHIAVALSGTPSQVPKLIASAEDGLFSRFLFYAFKSELCWQDPSPANQTIIYNDHFEALSQEVLRLVGFLQSTPTEVQLQPHQWAQLNTAFSEMLSDVAIFTGEEASSTVFRLGLVLFRLCMIFTALRKFENGDGDAIVQCTDEDFTTALSIARTFLQHSLLMFNNLPKQGEAAPFVGSNGKRKFYEALPQQFTRKEAVELGKTYQLSPRTVDDILRAADGHGLEKPKAGLYNKV